MKGSRESFPHLPCPGPRTECCETRCCRRAVPRSRSGRFQADAGDVICFLECRCTMMGKSSKS